MADFRPVSALRYDATVAGEPSDLIAPPYDVVSAEEAAALHERSPYNISRLDYGETLPGDDDSHNRYTRARDELQRWLAKGILACDPPTMYLYDQDFTAHGRRYRRRSVFGKLRLEEWDRGIVLPHEHTRAAAKADRYELLKATGINLSPIMAIYRNPTDRPLVEYADAGQPVLSARLDGERHVLRPLSPAAAARVQDSLAGERVYVADGHHRYEVALLYRNERKHGASSWSGEEPENFVLAALIDIEDPGLVVLPTHRLVKMPAPSPDLTGRLRPLFRVEDMGDSSEAAQVKGLLSKMTEAGRDGPAFGAIGLRRGRLHLVTVADRAGVDSRLARDHADAWRRLDVSVLHQALFPSLGNLSKPEEIEFTEDAHNAAAEVASGRWDVALLLNPTPVSRVLECADAGERMPQKSTYFYPKLATGVLMYPVDKD